MMTLLLTLFFACGEDTTYTCTETEVLQECDANGENCTDVEDCMEQGLMCHAEMGHCMAEEEMTEENMEDSGMNME